MFALRFIALCAGVIAVSLTSAHGLSDEERDQIKSLLVPLVKDCGKEYGVTEEDIKAAKKAGTLKDLDPCLMACVFKRIGIIDDKGNFNVDKSTELTKKFFGNDDEQSKALDIISTCASVNDQSVTDGDKGCDRAKLLVECYLPFKGILPDDA